MYKKDYVGIAEALIDTYPEHGNTETWENVVDRLCRTFANDNPQFSITRFRQYLHDRIVDHSVTEKQDKKVAWLEKQLWNLCSIQDDLTHEVEKGEYPHLVQILKERRKKAISSISSTVKGWLKEAR